MSYQTEKWLSGIAATTTWKRQFYTWHCPMCSSYVMPWHYTVGLTYDKVELLLVLWQSGARFITKWAGNLLQSGAIITTKFGRLYILGQLWQSRAIHKFIWGDSYFLSFYDRGIICCWYLIIPETKKYCVGFQEGHSYLM